MEAINKFLQSNLMENIEGNHNEHSEIPEFAKQYEAKYVTSLEQADEPLEPIRRVKTINEQLAGTIHDETGVPYKEHVVELPDGEKVIGVFPEFDSTADIQLDEREYLISDSAQEGICNKILCERIDGDPKFAEQFTTEQLEQIRNGDTPDGYTWHHNETPGLMQLVDTETHAKTRHTGGRFLWGGGSDNR
ncbi:HNH endonuclease [Paenibacillus agricola]|uniref:HNH endonuclease n=1 Tax=Paenibacillus agricola TaxID=2716264 RepID=A0ABX0JIS1_9BACL|nr:HNH endonuclease [Paenibacillus agricola]NHN34359.1 HNH endonuclease [Paenibacillus agricola]